MRKLLWLGLVALIAALGLVEPGRAQNTTYLVVTTCGTVPVPFKAGNPGPPTIDVNGNICGGSSGGSGVFEEKSTAAAPSYLEGSVNPVSGDLSGNTRVYDASVYNAVTSPVPSCGASPCTNWVGNVNVGSNNTGNSVSNPFYVSGNVTGLNSALTASFSVTRPTGGLTYTANTAFANSASVATYSTISGVCLASGGQVLIPDIFISTTDNATLKMTGELHLFTTTVTAINDNATWSVAAADVLNEVAVVPFNMTYVENPAATASGVQAVHLQNLSIQAQCTGSTNLYAMVKITNAYVAVASEVLSFRLKAIQIGSAYGTTVASSITRLNNTTTYTANTAWGNVAVTYGTLTNVCRAPGSSIIIPDVIVADQANQTLKLTGEMHLFNATVTPIADDATWSVAAADVLNEVGVVPFAMNYVENPAAGASGGMAAHVQGLGIQATCGSASANLYYMLKVTNAYVPVANEVLQTAVKALWLN